MVGRYRMAAVLFLFDVQQMLTGLHDTCSYYNPGRDDCLIVEEGTIISSP